jgi:hypothetical protein
MRGTRNLSFTYTPIVRSTIIECSSPLLSSCMGKPEVVTMHVLLSVETIVTVSLHIVFAVLSAM